MRKKLSVAALAAAAALSVCNAPVNAAGELPPASTKKVDYVTDIKPILKEKCYSCHGAEKQKGELRLDGKAEAMAGGESGAAIKAGDSAGSMLIQVVAGTHPDIDVMPPKGDKLTPEQIGLLRAWIDQGVAWPDAEAAAPPKVAPAK